MYVLDSLCRFVEVGDDLTGPKVSENLWRRRRRGRNIRETDSELASVGVRAALDAPLTALRLSLNEAIVCLSLSHHL